MDKQLTSEQIADWLYDCIYTGRKEGSLELWFQSREEVEDFAEGLINYFKSHTTEDVCAECGFESWMEWFM